MRSINRFFNRYSLLLMLLVSFLVFHPAPSLCAAVSPEHITLTWTSDTKTTQTITWETVFTDKAGKVQYIEAEKGKAFPQGAITVDASAEVFNSNQGKKSIHSATLNSLKPGTHYLYRVGDETSWSGQKAFTTAGNSSNFKVLIFGDSQSSNYDTWHTTISQAYKKNPDAVFFTNTGDLVNGSDFSEWNNWFIAVRGVADTIPAMPASGNHEGTTPQYFTAQFKLPNNGPENLKEQVYSFDYGNTHFVVLNSQQKSSMLERQKQWLEQDLRTTNKPWKIVVFHKPLYANEASQNNPDLRNAFAPILDKYHADVVFNGHEHIYKRTYPLNNGKIVDSPAKGTVYITAGRSGTKTYSDKSKTDLDAFFYNPKSEANYITVETKGSVLTVNMFTQSGKLVDTYTIKK